MTIGDFFLAVASLWMFGGTAIHHYKLGEYTWRRDRFGRVVGKWRGKERYRWLRFCFGVSYFLVWLPVIFID